MSELAFLTGGGAMGARIAAHDWSGSCLGPPGTWPAELRAALGLMLPAPLPMFLAWGPRLGLLYNDAYAALVVDRDPLGLDFADVWHDIADRLAPLLAQTWAGQSSIHTDAELLVVRDGATTQRWFSFSYSPVRDRHGGVAGLFFTCLDTTGAVMSARRREEANSTLSAIIETVPGLIYAKDLEGRMRLANAATLALLGKAWAEVEGRTDLEMLDAKDEARLVMENDKRVMREGRTETLEEWVTDAAGAARLWLSTKTPMRDGAGAVTGLLGLSVDITGRKQAEDHIRFLMGEISHRSKNLLAIIQGIAGQTARRATDLADFRERFERRLQGLATSHDLLVDQDWRGAELADLVREHLAPFAEPGGGRLSILGPPARLKAEAAQSLGLALHELATNAVKYGALSSPAGHVDIAWWLEADRLCLRWQESGGPAVVAPARRGFGHVVTERMVAQSLDGEVALDFAVSGLVWTGAFPSGTILLHGP